MQQQEPGGEGEGGQDQAGRRNEEEEPEPLVNNSRANILIRFLSQSYLL